MKLRILSLILALALLCGCTPQPPLPSQEPEFSTDHLARAMLAACENIETERVTGEDLSLWVTEFYGLSPDSWGEASLYRAADPSSAFELAVIRLTEQGDLEEGLYELETYLLGRQGDFAGYDPGQAAMVEGGYALMSPGGAYLALIICLKRDEASWAFYDALTWQERRASVPISTSGPTTPPTPIPTPSSSPISHMMEIYDTSAILSAWDSGDPSGLNTYDRAIYDRCREILTDILSEDMDDYQKERAVYHWVVRHVKYDYDHYNKLEGAPLDSSTPYHPLILGKGICMGFATTFCLLAELAGLECIIVPGKAFDSREDHAWNMVRLNGAWYCLDTTWDATGGTGWTYFNVTSQFMSATDHQWNEDMYPKATTEGFGKN